jgi:2-polyprenyl-3-methyl-5-hydroxy-6-metoxy-1,4-benzoquinol methylase/glycosyltransferase involved in cell wall biosynthesis
LKIILACSSLPFGPNTPAVKSLGGSETAALMAARELAKRGHEVILFTTLPAQGEPDFIPAAAKDDVGVRWMPIEMVTQYAMIHEHDLYISLRDPKLLGFPTLSKKRVLWAHDIFTKRGMQRALDEMAWTFDEIWAVSEWHKHQINEATGYPLENIVALRNGIVQVEPLLPRAMTVRKPKQLLYAARPERGLENLIRPGGIMDNLPDFKLVVAMYDHYPPHMKPFYDMIFQRMREMPNVEFVGGKSQPELRQLIAESAAYIYPTQFEETSCILAREVIEQHTPIFTTFVGALPETLGDSGIFFEPWLHTQGITEPERGTPGWNQLFAAFVKQALGTPEVAVFAAVEAMQGRTDLYWDGVAELMEENALPKPVSITSRIWSLIQAGDVIPARALFQDYLSSLHPGEDLTPMQASLLEELRVNYTFIEGDIQGYYDAIYSEKAKTDDSELIWTTKRNDDRWNAIAQQIAALPEGSTVYELGCGSGHVLVPLAVAFPNINFVGTDFSATSVGFIERNAAEAGITNLKVAVNSVGDVGVPLHSADAVICSEVLEHVEKPWELLTLAESTVKLGGLVVLTTPFGAWEPLTYEQQGKWDQRAHLWHIDQQMMQDMFDGAKPGQKFMGLVQTVDAYHTPIGNLVTVYQADHRPIAAVSPLAKAWRHISKPTVAAAVIAYNNEDTIVRMLNSLLGQVQFVRIAMGPSTDMTRELVERWFDDHPMIRYQIIDVPKIEPWKFGFDEARNISAAELDEFDWVLWIDTDEYLAGDFRKYLRNSAMQGYLVAQHHFTVEPRGRAPEIDRPARLFRTGQGYQARGHIHEHFEVPEGGPGRCWMLPDVDLGHTGYVNEEVRKGRFERNFPFLQWDHEDGGGDRKLHHFLWFRDIVHRMRFEQARQNMREAEKLAHEARAYYNEHTEDMAAFGPGIFMALQYIGEVNKFLGQGIPLRMTIQFEDRQAVLESNWTDFAHVEKVFKQFVETEFTERTSRYY